MYEYLKHIDGEIKQTQESPFLLGFKDNPSRIKYHLSVNISVEEKEEKKISKVLCGITLQTILKNQLCESIWNIMKHVNHYY